MLGTNIRAARKAKGWTQKELAEQIGSNASYVNRLEIGKVNPSVGVLERIADALECSLDHLVKGQGDDPEVHVRDKSLAERLRLIDALEEKDRETLLHLIDTMLTKKRMRELLDGISGPRAVGA